MPFNPSEYDDDYEDEFGDEPDDSFDTPDLNVITDLDQLYEYEDYYDYELDTIEFHGTGDTGSES